MKEKKAAQQFFTRVLIGWHHTGNDRQLPWKQEKDPYRIWLSEVILQQTRAQQGLPYYLRFTEAYPTVKDMARAEEAHAFRLWQGLGYYNRCKNMLATARYIADELKGKFPRSYEGLLQLKGIGPYTASAIASFAFGLPHAVVDGNVYRVLSRFFGIETPIDSTEGKKQFQELATELLDTNDPAAYNQAIMDLGATVCTPQSPVCDECPLQQHCFAFQKGVIRELPVKSKRQSVRNRYFHYLLLHRGNEIWIHKRTGKDIWQNLHEPLLIEDVTALDTNTLAGTDQWKEAGLPENIPVAYEGSLKQRLTHQLIETRFYSIKIGDTVKLPDNDGMWVDKNDLKKMAFPKTVVSFFEKKLYF
ncbi:A/G-specific adenine glycosylase [Chitinophagaceae bacterium MMS25-I14]